MDCCLQAPKPLHKLIGFCGIHLRLISQECSSNCTVEWVWQFKGILPKGPYLPCVNMAGWALFAGYPRILLLKLLPHLSGGQWVKAKETIPGIIAMGSYLFCNPPTSTVILAKQYCTKLGLTQIKNVNGNPAIRVRNGLVKKHISVISMLHVNWHKSAYKTTLQVQMVQTNISWYNYVTYVFLQWFWGLSKTNTNIPYFITH